MFKIKLIAFDIFGVVITEGHMISSVLMPLLPQGTDKSNVKKYYELYTIGQIEEAEFWSAIGHPDDDVLRETFLSSFETDPDLHRVAKTLSDRFDFALLSNVSIDWYSYLNDKYHFDRSFAPNIISGIFQCGKPDDSIYHQLLLHSNQDADQVAFVDDRLENLEPAHKLGMTTIHYQRENSTSNFKPDFSITKLDQLFELSCFKIS